MDEFWSNSIYAKPYVIHGDLQLEWMLYMEICN